MPIYVWNDPSPVDGCDLVRFTVQAESMNEAASLARDVPWSRCRTGRKLREVGMARLAGDDEQLPSTSSRGVVFWEATTGWRAALEDADQK